MSWKMLRKCHAVEKRIELLSRQRKWSSANTWNVSGETKDLELILNSWLLLFEETCCVVTDLMICIIMDAWIFRKVFGKWIPESFVVWNKTWCMGVRILRKNNVRTWGLCRGLARRIPGAELTPVRWSGRSADVTRTWSNFDRPRNTGSQISEWVYYRESLLFIYERE